MITSKQATTIELLVRTTADEKIKNYYHGQKLTGILREIYLEVVKK